MRARRVAWWPPDFPPMPPPTILTLMLEQYEQMRVRKERFDRNLARVRECFADMSSAEVEQLVDEAVTAVRREKRAEAAAK